jgi:phosphatidylinositol 4-kinase
VQAAPFIKNDFLSSVPFYVVPTLGTSLLAIGTVYWLIWAKVLPAFGYHIQHEIVQMPDGSERVKYKVSLSPELERWWLADMCVCYRGSSPRNGGGRGSGSGSGSSLFGDTGHWGGGV